jgi:hypothetical protein
VRHHQERERHHRRLRDRPPGSQRLGGTPRDLDIITDYWVKSETALDNDEAWVKTTQTAASEITAIAGTAELEMIVTFAVYANQLSDGYTHIAVNVPDFGNTDTEYGCVLYIPFGLKTQRTPVEHAEPRSLRVWRTPNQ